MQINPTNSKTLPTLLLALLLPACQPHPPAAPLIQPATQPTVEPTTAPSRSAANLLLGNPSAATADPQNKNNFLLIHPYYTLSYNNDAGEPNWVSWLLTKQDIGAAPRRRTFAPDTDLPAGITRITHRDYTNSGFDRGHMCPHSDRSADTTMAYATFTMTNVVPQAPNLNQKAWNQEEIYLRDLAQNQNAHIYTIAGPIAEGPAGTGEFGPATTIANGKVKVPAYTWKIAVIVPPGPLHNFAPDLARITAATRVLAVIMPNQNSVDDSWSQYRTSVAEIEKATGYTFFTNLPPQIAVALKNKIDAEPLPPPVDMHYPQRDRTKRPTTTPEE